MKHKKLSLTYIIALSVIAVLVIIGCFVVSRSASALSEDGVAINLAGRQRMLSQKLSKASLSMQQSTDITTFNNAKKELRETLDLFTKSQSAIQLGNEVMEIPEPTLSEESKNFFKEINPSFEALKTGVTNLVKLNFSNEVDTNMSAFQQNIPLILQNESVFLTIMNSIVAQFEKEYKGKTSTLNMVIYGVTGTILLTLFLLAVLFFQPLVLSIKKFITDIESANSKLKENQEEILKSSQISLESNEKMFTAQKDLQKTQATLKQSETLFRSVIENAPLVIFSLDKQGNFILSEGQGLLELGLKSGQVVGLSAFDLYKDTPSIIADLEAVLQGGIPIESISVLGDAYFENRFTPLKDQFGNVTGMVGISSNITERQKFQQQLQTAEEETRKSLDQQKAANERLIIAQEKIQNSEEEMRKFLEKSLEATEKAFILQKEVEKSQVEIKDNEAKLRSITDNTEDIILSVDKELNLIFVNQAFRTLYKDAIKVGDNILNLFPPHAQETYKNQFERSLAGEHFVIENEISGTNSPLDGWYREAFNPVRNVEGNVIACSCFVQNITARKNAEEKVKKVSKQMKEASILTKMGSWELEANLDGSNAFFTYTDEYFTLCGTSVEEYGSYIVSFEKWLSDFTFEESHESLKSALVATLQNPVFEGEVEFIHKNQKTGEKIYTIAKISSKIDNVAGKVHVLGTAQNITDSKLLQIEAQARQKRLAKHTETLLELSSINFSEMSLPKSYETITRLTAIGLDVERVSIWEYKPDRIVVRKLFQKAENQFTTGTELFEKDYPNYFEELKSELIITANDANTDPATAEFSENYLKPLGIGAMLDIPIRLEGKMVGVLCHEHIGGERKWEADEISFGKAVADIISLAFEANKRQLVQKDLEEYSKELKQMFKIVQENEVKLDNALKLAKIYEYDFDLERMIVGFSDAFWTDILEIKKIDNMSIGEFTSKFVYPEDIAYSNEQLGLLIDSSDSNLTFTFEIRYISTTNNIKTIEITVQTPIRNEAGLPVRVLGTGQDITERKAAALIIENTNKELVANEVRLSGTLKELRVIQNQMIVSAKNDKALALKRGITEEELDNPINIDNYKELDFSYIEELKAKNLPVPENEVERLKALYDYDLLDTEAEEDLDGLTKLAAFVCGTPISLISLIDKDRQWFKSDYGLGVEETARDIAFCHYAIMDTKVFEVENALEDTRFKDNPLVQGAPDIRFYAGAPLTTPDGYNIGTLCVIDKKEAKLSQEQKEALEVIASEVMARLEAKRQKQVILAINNKALVAFEELEKAQDEIQESEKRFTNIAANTPDLIYQFFVTQEGKASFPYASPAIETIFELKAEDLKDDAMPLIGLIATENRNNFQEIMAVSAEKMEAFTYEGKFITPSGKIKWIRAQAKPELEDNGILYNGTMTDITGIKEAQAIVERLSLVASKTDNTVIIADKDGLIDWVNDGFVKLSGRTLEEVKGKKPGQLLQGIETDPKQVAEFREKLLTKKTFYQEIYNYSKTGRGYWIASNVTPVVDENNEITQYISIGIDITNRKNAEKVLEQAQNDTKDALEMQKIINDSMIVAQRELAKKNDQLEKSEEEMREIMERQLEANEQLMMAEKKLQNALNNELASKVELERTYGTLKDAQSQLVHSEKMASLGQLTAGIAHEINNPINFVYNGIDTLKMSLDELLEIVEKYAELDKAEDKEKVLKEVQVLKRQLSYGELLGDINSLVSDIKKGAVRTMEIVKGLRVFSRLDEEEKKFANVSDCLDATLVLLNNKFKGKIEIRKLYDDSMKEINCYPGQLNQVFMNIINNAIQAIPEGRKDGLITIYTETQEENVVIRIKDNGAGMSEQVRKRVFEPFFTTKAVGVGTGLGMSITFGIIQKHNGQIFVNSEEGKGTEFVIQIPKNLE